jgi:hypothetical protein
MTRTRELTRRLMITVRMIRNRRKLTPPSILKAHPDFRIKHPGLTRY